VRCPRHAPRFLVSTLNRVNSVTRARARRAGRAADIRKAVFPAKTRRRIEGEDKKAAYFLLYLDASYLDVPNLTRRSTRTAAHFDVVLLLRFN